MVPTAFSGIPPTATAWPSGLKPSSSGAGGAPSAFVPSPARTSASVFAYSNKYVVASFSGLITASNVPSPADVLDALSPMTAGATESVLNGSSGAPTVTPNLAATRQTTYSVFGTRVVTVAETGIGELPVRFKAPLSSGVCSLPGSVQLEPAPA